MSSETQFIQGDVISSGSGRGQVYYIMKRKDGTEFVAVFPIDEDPGLSAGPSGSIPYMTPAGSKDGRDIYKRISGTVTALNENAEPVKEPKIKEVSELDVLITTLCTMMSYQQGEGAKTPEQNVELMKIEAARWKALGLI